MRAFAGCQPWDVHIYNDCGKYNFELHTQGSGVFMRDVGFSINGAVYAICQSYFLLLDSWQCQQQRKAIQKNNPQVQRPTWRDHSSFLVCCASSGASVAGPFGDAWHHTSNLLFVPAPQTPRSPDEFRCALLGCDSGETAHCQETSRPTRWCQLKRAVYRCCCRVHNCCAMFRCLPETTGSKQCTTMRLLGVSK